MDRQIECVCKSPHSHREREAPQRWNTKTKLWVCRPKTKFYSSNFGLPAQQNTGVSWDSLLADIYTLSQLTPAVVTKVWLAIMLYKWFDVFVMLNPFCLRHFPFPAPSSLRCLPRPCWDRASTGGGGWRSWRHGFPQRPPQPGPWGRRWV